MTSPVLPPETLLTILLLVQRADRRGVPACALVSKDWHACVTTILYSDIQIVWLSRRGKNLIRTISASPALALLVHTLAVSHPPLVVWTRTDVDALVTMAKDKLWDDFLAGSEEHESVSWYDWEDSHFDRESVCEQELGKVWGKVDEEGNGEWMDWGPRGVQARYEGARAAMGLVGRLPRLRTLDLDNVDWGPGNLVLGPPLESLVSLWIRHTESSGTAATLLSALLARTPHLEDLDITVQDGSDLPLLPILSSSKIHTIGLEIPFSPLFLSSLTRLVGPTLLETHITLPRFADDAEETLVTILSALPSLVTLTASAAPFSDPASPTAAFPPRVLSLLASATALRSLMIPYTPSAALIASLPPHITTLSSKWTREDLMHPQDSAPPPPWLDEVLRALVVRRKAGELQGLERVELDPKGGNWTPPLVIVYEGIGEGERKAVKELSGMGVEVVSGVGRW